MNRQIPEIMKNLALATNILDQALLIDEAVALNDCPIDFLMGYDDLDWTDLALQRGALKFLCLARQYYPPLDQAHPFLAKIFPYLQHQSVKDWICAIYQLGIQIPQEVVEQLMPLEHPEIRRSLPFLLAKQDWKESRSYLLRLCQSEYRPVANWAKYHLEKMNQRSEDDVYQDAAQKEHSAPEMLSACLSNALQDSKRLATEEIYAQLCGGSANASILRAAAVCKNPVLYGPIWWSQWGLEVPKELLEHALVSSFWDPQEGLIQISRQLASPEIGSAYRTELLGVLLRREDAEIPELAQAWMTSKDPYLRALGGVIVLFHGGPDCSSTRENTFKICEVLRMGEVLSAISLVPFLARSLPSLIEQVLQKCASYTAPSVTWHLKAATHRWYHLPPEYQLLRCLHTCAYSTRFFACVEMGESIANTWGGDALQIKPDWKPARILAAAFGSEGLLENPHLRNPAQEVCLPDARPVWQREFNRLADKYPRRIFFGMALSMGIATAMIGFLIFQILN